MDYLHIYILKNCETVKFIKQKNAIDCDAVIGADGKIYDIIFEDFSKEEKTNNIPKELILDYVGTVNYVKEEK